MGVEKKTIFPCNLGFFIFQSVSILGDFITGIVGMVQMVSY